MIEPMQGSLGYDRVYMSFVYNVSAWYPTGFKSGPCSVCPREKIERKYSLG
jgi:hypothetical protein